MYLSDDLFDHNTAPFQPEQRGVLTLRSGYGPEFASTQHEVKSHLEFICNLSLGNTSDFHSV